MIVQPIKLAQIKEEGDERFNSNNHHENGIPSNYHEILGLSSMHHWISKFRTNFVTIEIKQNDLTWLKKAYLVGRQTGRFPQMFNDELKEMLESYNLDTIFNDDKQYFIRTNKVSLKYGVNGLIAYNNFKDVVHSLVTCISGHTPINEFTTDLTLYLFPWIRMDEYKEFRVFVNNNKITAISQQKWCSVNEYLVDKDNKLEIVNNWIDIIYNYFDKTIKERITHISCYCIDLSILENDVPYFIEINSFGKEYASGSSLFHWLIDETILYDYENKNNIYFRYVEN
jgi:hypothetical protein